MKVLHGNEKLIINEAVQAGDEIAVSAIVQHNYPALSEQVKLMLTGQFNIAQQWLFKAGSEPYNDDGELIDYSGEGNDASVGNNNVIKFDGSEGYASATASGVGAGNFYYYYAGTVPTDDGTYNHIFSDGGASTGGKRLLFGVTSSYMNINIDDNSTSTNHQLVEYSSNFTAGDYIRFEAYRTGTTVYWSINNVSEDTMFSGSFTDDKDFSSSQYLTVAGIQRATTGAIIGGEFGDIEFDILKIGTTSDSIVASYTGATGGGLTIYNRVGSNNLTINSLSYVSFLTNNLAYPNNLVYGFTDSSSVYVPYDVDGVPIASTGTNHPAGNFHNQAETKITPYGYTALTYTELKALAISDNRFELVEDEDGNISELKVTKLTDTDTEHYTADNNNQQTLMESGNLTSLIDQTVKLLIQGGDNDNIAATKTITLPSGGEITVNAATSGEDGNNIQIVFVAGGTRGIAVVEGSTIFITLTYEAGDDLSDCTGELNSVDNLITYNIDVDGALSDDSGFLTGGFTPKLTISEVIFNNQSLFAMAINSSFLIIYIRQNAAYTQPTDAAEWAALLVTMTKLGAMELKETQLLINPETIEQDTGNQKAVLYKAVFQARDLNYTPETAAEYTASWENQEVDILIHDSTQGYAIMVPEIILHATEKANSGAVSYLELKAEKTGISKNTLRDLFDVPE